MLDLWSGLRTSDAKLSLKIVSALAMRNSDMLAWSVMLWSMSNCSVLLPSISLDFRRFGAQTMARFLVFMFVSEAKPDILNKCCIRNTKVLLMEV